MFILTNVSRDTDGMVYAGHPSFFETEEEAIKNAKENLADDFGIDIENIENEADQIGGTPFVLSMAKDGRLETYTVSKMPDEMLGKQAKETGLKKLYVTAYPYVTQEGSILVPKELQVEDYENYVRDRFDEINFSTIDCDYAGTDFEIRED